MKRPIFFLLVALATISVITAIPLLPRDSVSFSSCEPQIPLLGVTIPGPIVSNKPITFNISGTAPSEISEGYIMGVAFVSTTGDILKKFGNDFCKLYKSCPVKENTAFNLQDEITAPNNLPGTYGVVVGILDLQKKPVMCAKNIFVG